MTPFMFNFPVVRKCFQHLLARSADILVCGFTELSSSVPGVFVGNWGLESPRNPQAGKPALHAHLPVAPLPPLLALPKEGEGDHGIHRPVRGWEIGEPEIQSILMDGVGPVGVRPVIR